MIMGLFAATNPTLNDYKEKFTWLSVLSENLTKGQSYVDVGCIRIDYSEYKVKQLERCVFWHSAFGKQLILECDIIMMTFSEKIKVSNR